MSCTLLVPPSLLLGFQQKCELLSHASCDLLMLSLLNIVKVDTRNCAGGMSLRFTSQKRITQTAFPLRVSQFHFTEHNDPVGCVLLTQRSRRVPF